MITETSPDPFTRGIWISRLVVRTLQLISSIVMISLAANMMSNGLISMTTLAIAGSSAGPGIIYTFIDALCILCRKGHRSVHPGVNVALDLLLFLSFIGTIIWFSLISVAAKLRLESIELSYASSRSGSSSSSTSSDVYAGYRASSGYMGLSKPCTGVVGGTPDGSSCYTRRATVGYEGAVSVMQEVIRGTDMIIGLGAMLVILHFVSFVIACVETHKHRLKRHQASFIMHNTPSNAEQAFKLGGYKKLQEQSPASVKAQFTAYTGYRPADWKAYEAHPGTPLPIPACLVPGGGRSPVKMQQTFHLPSPARGQSPVHGQQTHFKLPAPQYTYGLPQNPSPTYQKLQSENKTRYEFVAELMDSPVSTGN